MQTALAPMLRCGPSELLGRPPGWSWVPVRYSKVSKRRKERQRELAPHLTAISKGQSPSQFALDIMDDTYRKSFAHLWPSIRLGLVSRRKNCALINNFGPIQQTRDRLTSLGAYSLRELLPETWPLAPARIQSQAPVAGPPRADEAEDPGAIAADLPSMPTDALSLAGRLISPQARILGRDNDATALYDFVPPTQLKGDEDIVEEAEFYDHYVQIETAPIQVRPEPTGYFPPNLDAYLFPYSSFEAFPQPARQLTQTFDYFCLDVASLLPVVALGLRPQDYVLDMCAGPGGKSLAILQTLLPSKLVCNDFNSQRLRRVSHVMNMYLEGVDSMQDVVELSRLDGQTLHASHANGFDKVLCDVPCLTDRQSATVDHDNIFSAAFKSKRIQLPQTQVALLVSALKCTRPGGSVVYSTCSLSPVQNDGVVYTALRQIWEETNIECYISDLSEVIRPFQDVMRIHKPNPNLKYGQLILPDITKNFGPMYLAKIVRTR